MKPLPIFLYGTLREGERNRHLVAGAIVRSLPATLRGTLQVRLDDDYPYPCLLPGVGAVVGELAYLDPRRYSEALKVIDTLEEYDPGCDSGLYLRRRVNVDTADGPLEAWTYLWNGPLPAGPLLEDGDFSRWNRGAQAGKA